MSMHTRHQEGFTLVELSIVLVIIGLLVSGILVGQNLIEAATIRSQAKQIEDFNTTVNAFRNKYNALPGDITNAKSAPWGLTASAGNGNGLLQDTTPATVSHNGEIAFLWQHLSEADMIAGSYTAGTTIGTNFPEAKIGRGGIVGLSTAGFNWWVLGANTTGAAALNAIIQNTITPKEAIQIDTKMDDGIPNNGVVYSTTHNGTNLTTSTAGAANCWNANVYNASLDTPLCALAFRFN